MTDKEKLDKLVAEIERRITFFKKQSVRKTTTDDNSCALALQGVLCFYDSMQEESKKEAVIEVEKIMAEVDAKFPKFAEEVGDIHSCDPHFGVNIEPVSEDLEEAAKNYMMSQNPPIWGLYDGFIAGANWQKEKMMAKAIDATCFGIQGAALFTFRLPAGSYLVGSKVKVIVVKED